MAIPANQARANFTSALVGVFMQMPKVTDFLNLFFPDKVERTRYLSWQIKREGEPLAVDVIRGGEGNRNTFSISSEKIVDPPFYNEYTDVTSTDLYYRAFGSDQVDEGALAEFNVEILQRLQSMQNKISRRLELQRAQVLQTGIVTLVNGDNVDFKRKAGSMVDPTAGSYWTDSTTNPFTQLAAGASFLRGTGKAEGSNFILIMGENALAALLTNPFFKDRQDKFNLKLDDLAAPLRQATGAAYHGRITFGSYTGDIFTYPQSYDASGTPTAYITTTNVIMIPENPGFITGYGAVPMLPAAQLSHNAPALPSIVPGKFVIGEWTDGRSKAWNVDISSAGIALPTWIDRIYTLKATAA